MKKIRILIGILCLVFSLSGCAGKEASEAAPAAGDYVTLTMTGYNNEEDPSDGMTTQIWYYDIASGDLQHPFDFETTAQYSLGFYDRAHQKVYYTARLSDESADQHGDQIFVCDLQTKQETQLTSQFFAVNDIVPVQDRLYFLATLHGDSAMRLGYLDLTTGDVQFWRDDGDTFVETMTVDAENNRVYCVGYSLEERNRNLENQGNGDFVIPAHTVYQTDLDFSSTETFYTDHAWLRAIMTRGETIEVLSDEKYNHSEIPTTIVSIDLKTGDVQKTAWEKERLQQEKPNYTSDGTAIYGIVVVGDSRGLGRYDVKTQEMELCFETPPGTFMNNIHVVWE